MEVLNNSKFKIEGIEYVKSLQCAPLSLVQCDVYKPKSRKVRLARINSLFPVLSSS